MKQLSVLVVALLFALAPALKAQTYTVVHNFGSNDNDAVLPYTSGTISQSRGGAMFSTAGGGEDGTLARAFRITTTGATSTLHTFHTGQKVSGGLTLATDGLYYGTANNGGTYGKGVIFKMTQDGVITPLYSFHGGTDGGYPTAEPIQSVAGDFYGTTEGRTGNGSVYRINKYGDFTLLHTFTGTPDGAHPYGPLVQGTDFNFYGTTELGGTHGAGTIFRISSKGDFKVVYNFDFTHGAYPFAGLIQANDGSFYGVTAYGGSMSEGTVFKMTPSYAISVLHSFAAGLDGGTPMGGLVQATDGNLYGSATGYGTADGGVLFRITLGGKYTVLHDFDSHAGSGGGYTPISAMLQHTNGVLYGMTLSGGVSYLGGGLGTFYSLDLGLKPFVTYLSTYGRAGALVQILGQGFTADSVVSFNGVPASSTIVSSTYIRAFVPGGATSGPITVTTASGTLTSNKTFIVHAQ
jgi:uncharacterized repeat protein (TIGR03803 family)